MDHEYTLKGPVAKNPQTPLPARLLLGALKDIRIGKLEVFLPGGAKRIFGGRETGPWARWIIRDAGAIRRIMLRGDLGFAEGYLDGEWDTPSLQDLLMLLDANREVLGRAGAGRSLMRMADVISHWLRPNSRRGAKRNIADHYDLGNDFYRLWLDETMTYSSAVFEAPAQSLADAQRNKYRLLLNRLDLGSQDHLLEIGSGWGGFAIHAARETGCRVTSITLSEAQLREARSRAEAAGLADRVSFELRDYRDIQGRFDAIASIEMFEAVGERYWPAYFETLYRSLKPGGRAALQAITLNERDFPRYRTSVDFIQRYIFPGGMLPSVDVFDARAKRAGLRTVERIFYGKDYAETLARWDERVFRARERILALGYDERFLRLWHYYLAYCETGFRHKRTDVMQVLLERPAQ